MIAVSIRSLRYYEGDRAILLDLDAEFFEGEISCVISEGEEGRALLRLIAGIYKPLSGTVTLFGSSQSSSQVYTKEVVFIPKAFTLPQNVVVRHYVTKRLTERGMDARSAEELATRLMGELGIAHLIDAKAAVLSEGERKFMAMIVELLHLPKLALIEDPTFGLPLRYRWILREKLRRLTKAPSSIILASTDPSVTSWADRIYLLKEGQVVASGGFGEVLRRLGGGENVVITTKDRRSLINVLKEVKYVKRIGIDKDGNVRVWLEDFDENVTDFLRTIFSLPVYIDRIGFDGMDRSKELERMMGKLFLPRPP